MRIGRVHGRLVIIDGDGVVDVATVSGGEFSADPDRVFAVWDRFTEWAGRYAGPGARTGPLVRAELGAPVLAPSQVFRHRPKLPGARRRVRRAGASCAAGVHQVPQLSGRSPRRRRAAQRPGGLGGRTGRDDRAARGTGA